ncbi:hypothetical protein [Streptomyces sp. MP131-18]|uniref:hypothetical protein n=1 Tax=Streptomyces sp. MP131-18 TaxID=1857892 RepID=UPI00097CADAC|nr:hypothetical protein [Streptomyces sp. MP131-18]ONK09254.1 hypothetical protein STBA_71090 [Streptomyces sp. MP131-18]
MAINFRKPITAGGKTIHSVHANAGLAYPEQRRDVAGWGAMIEIPAVVLLLESITTGEITPLQAREALAPILAELAVYEQEMDQHSGEDY